MDKTKSSKLEQIIMIIASIILIPIVLINSILIVKSYTDPDNMPSVFGIAPVVVLSGSMYPTFDAEAMIFIKEVDPSTLEVGDVITYLKSGVAITHRIYEITEVDGVLKFTTKGDANNTTDALAVYEDQIQGQYITHIEGIGAFVIFMQSTTGVIVFVAIPIALYIAYDIWKRRGETKKEKSKTAELEAQLAKLRGEESQGE